MSAATDARGLKRVCVHCGIRFYDMNKRPIKCPNCANEFSGEIKLKARRGRVAAVSEIEEKAKVPVPADDADTIEEREDGLVSLEDVEAAENAVADDDEDIALVEDEDLGDIGDLEEELVEEVEDDKKA